jgi:hypothetical protein
MPEGKTSQRVDDCNSVRAIYILIRKEIPDEEQLIEDLGNLLDRYGVCPGGDSGSLIAIAKVKEHEVSPRR